MLCFPNIWHSRPWWAYRGRSQWHLGSFRLRGRWYAHSRRRSRWGQLRQGRCGSWNSTPRGQGGNGIRDARFFVGIFACRTAGITSLYAQPVSVCRPLAISVIPNSPNAKCDLLSVTQRLFVALLQNHTMGVNQLRRQRAWETVLEGATSVASTLARRGGEEGVGSWRDVAGVAAIPTEYIPGSPGPQGEISAKTKRWNMSEGRHAYDYHSLTCMCQYIQLRSSAPRPRHSNLKSE